MVNGGHLNTWNMLIFQSVLNRPSQTLQIKRSYLSIESVQEVVYKRTVISD